MEAYLVDPTPSGASCATRSLVWMCPCLSHSTPVSPTRRCVASRRRYSPERSRSQVAGIVLWASRHRVVWRCSACRYLQTSSSRSQVNHLHPPDVHAPGTRRPEDRYRSGGRARFSWRRCRSPGLLHGTRTSGTSAQQATPSPPTPFFISGSPLSHDPTPPPNVQGRRDARVPRGRDPPHLTRQTRLPQRALRTQAALRREDAALQTSRTGRLHRRRHLRAATAHRDRRRQARGPRHQGRRPGDRRRIGRPAGTVHVRFPPAQRRRGW